MTKEQKLKLQRSDFDWFVKNFKSLFKKYGKKVLVIKNKKVIGVFDDQIKAIDITSKKEPLGTFIVQECGPDESSYTNYIFSPNFSL